MAKIKIKPRNKNKDAIQDNNYNNKDNIKDKNSKNNFVIGLIVVIAIVGLVIALPYIIKPKPKYKSLDDHFEEVLNGKINDTQYLYNGFTFVKQGQMWFTQVQTNRTLFDATFQYSPKELDNISMEKLGEGFYAQNHMFITNDPDDKNLQYIAVSAGKISLALARAVRIMPLAACTQNKTDACAAKPIIDCATDRKDPIIQIEQANKTEILIEKNCIYIKGKDSELARASERFLMGVYGIIPSEQASQPIKNDESCSDSVCTI